MNNKIKAAEVACLIDGNEAYDQIYNSLKDSLPTAEEMIFAERTSGAGFLQWELPGDGWTSLDRCDPVQSNALKKELERRLQHVRSKFGENQTMADKILSYPDESYAFFKTSSDGKLLILLTAWGYRHPEKIGGLTAEGRFRHLAKENVVLIFTCGGEPMSEVPFKLNGMSKETDTNGIFEVGDLPLGYEFDVEVNKENRHIAVVQGKGRITIDLTPIAEEKVVPLQDRKDETPTENLAPNTTESLTTSNNKEVVAAEPKETGEGWLPSLLMGLGLAVLVAAAFYFGWRLL